MSGSWSLFESGCNLDQVRLKTLDLQLSGLFQTKAPQMTQCSSDVTVFNPNGLPDRSVLNPEPRKFLIWQNQKQPNWHWFRFDFNSGHKTTENAVLYLKCNEEAVLSFSSSSAQRIPPILNETAPTLLLYAATRDDFLFLSCLGP